MELFCPRDFGSIESEEDLRKHLFSHPCREFMIKIRWLEHNGFDIELQFKGSLKRLSEAFTESKATRLKELSEGIKKKMESFANTGTSGDKHIDSALHKKYKWLGPGKIQARVREKKSVQEE